MAFGPRRRCVRGCAAPVRRGGRSLGGLVGTALAVVGSVLGVGRAWAGTTESGPIQISPAGRWVWCVATDHGTVARLDTLNNSVRLIGLPERGEPHRPTGVAISGDGSRVWVACMGSDRIFVLDDRGAVVGEIPLPHGSAPRSLAFTSDGSRVVALLWGAGEAAILDAQSLRVERLVTGLFDKPFGACAEPGTPNVWITHGTADGEDGHVSLLDAQAGVVASRVILKSINPKDRGQIPNGNGSIPEGGYLLPAAHPSIRPGGGRLVLPVRYHNFHNDQFSPDSTVQGALHQIDLSTRLHLGEPDRVVLTAVEAHRNNGTLIGPGWNARLSGPVDLAYDVERGVGYVVGEYSNDVVVFPAGIGMARGEAPPLVEIPVGDNPRGIALSASLRRGYVLNHLSRDVSVIDLDAQAEIARVAIADPDAEPLEPEVLAGARLFFSSSDPRLSAGKVSCASCHLEGGTDGFSWDFTQFGTGNRKTLTLLGQGLSMGPREGDRGQLHRGGDRDEVQDFEHTIRSGLMGGTGLIVGAPNPGLGAPNAGRSAALDQLAQFVLSLPAPRRSPAREADGVLSERALRGAAIFLNDSGNALDAGCIDCHRPDRFTDLRFHDVGGQRQNGDRQGPTFNTPTLVGAWLSGNFVQATGDFRSGHSLYGVVRDARDGRHGSTGGLSRVQQRDLAAFLESIDLDLAEEGLGGLADEVPPRLLHALPVSAHQVELIFSEALDDDSAEDAGRYRVSDGVRTLPVRTAVLDREAGNRVRLGVDLLWPGCFVTYTVTAGPIEDRAGAVQGGKNNVLMPDSPGASASFDVDGTITVTFGGGEADTIPFQAQDAGFNSGFANVGFGRWWLFPSASPETKGFLRFDVIDRLRAECDVNTPDQIVDAWISVWPELGHQNRIELRRAFLPWGEPPNDWCFNCTGTVTRDFAQYGSIRWRRSGAAAVGGDPNLTQNYYPNGATDAAGAADASGEVEAINAPARLEGEGLAGALRFWFANPHLNFGWVADIAGDSVRSTEFYGSDFEGGLRAATLGVTFTLTPVTGEDCNGNGVSDVCDILSGRSRDDDGDGTPDECACAADVNRDGRVDGSDFLEFLSRFFSGDPRADLDDSGRVDGNDFLLFLSLFFEGC